MPPDFELEHGTQQLVFGLDEVGRAPLCGPVVVGCVYIPKDKYDAPVWASVNDSKKLSKKKREALFEDIKAACLWSVAEASVQEVENLNIVGASFLAMKRALLDVMRQIDTENEYLALIDGHISPKNFPCPTQTVIKGDSKSISIAAASILAKVARDRYMEKLAGQHPHYGWERNAGYPTREHLEAINTHGLTSHHRKTFAPVRNFLDHGDVQEDSTLPARKNALRY